MTRNSPILAISLYVASLVGGYYVSRYLFGWLWQTAFLVLVGTQTFSLIHYLWDLRRNAVGHCPVSDRNDGSPSNPA